MFKDTASVKSAKSVLSKDKLKMLEKQVRISGPASQTLTIPESSKAPKSVTLSKALSKYTKLSQIEEDGPGEATKEPEKNDELGK